MSTETTHIETEKQLVPALRFREFNGDWNESRLNDVAEFKKGKGISKAYISEDGVLECIRYGELYTTYTELIQDIVSKTNLPAKDLILSEFNDVIIPASGESNIDIATASCVLKSGVAYSGDLNVIRSKMDGIFLSFYLNNKRKFDIARLAQGVSVVHLYSSQLKTLKLNFPSLPEQQKIASFLSAVDEKIQQLTKKKKLLEQYKKGVMQQLFSGQLRFKDENGNDYPGWKEKALGEVMEIPKKVKPTSFDVNKLLTVKLHTKGLFKNERTESLKLGATNYFVRDEGQFIYGKQNLFNGAFGIIPKKFDGFYSSSDIPALDFIKGTVDPKFVLFYLSRKSYYDRLENIASGSGSKRIHETIFLEIEINFPCIEEQQKIATYLSGIDAKIEAVTHQITQTQTFKKGLLQQMFV